MKARGLRGGVVALALLLAAVWIWKSRKDDGEGRREGRGSEAPVRSVAAEGPVAEEPPTGEKLLEGYGDPNLTAAEDLRRLQRVVWGYHSVTKDRSRDPVGGNEDLAAVLQGRGREGRLWVRRSHPLFRGGDLLLDRWGRPLAVHPLGWQQLELRSAGEDGKMYSEDDVVIDPDGRETRMPEEK